MKINMDKIIRALSLALDLAQMSALDNNTNMIVEEISNIDYSKHVFMNHSKRVCYISLELAHSLQLDYSTIEELYVSSLLHDIGASNFFNRSHSYPNFIKEHCLIGSEITSDFPKFNNLSTLILYHHENHDGTGPMKLKNTDIPLASQIMRLADILDLLYDDSKPCYTQKEYISSWIEKHSNIIFSPALIKAFSQCSSKDSFWFNLENINLLDVALKDLLPEFDVYLTLDEFKKIAYIFGNIIDNKNEFTARHSTGISELAYSVAKHLGYDNEKCLKMKIAGLLHDIGKVAIPNNILEKNGPLTKDQFNIIKSHVYYTKVILDKMEVISDISDWASNHHEKLNGKGYPRALSSNEISEESRIMGVCDIYQALTEERPYRKGLSPEETFKIMDDMAKNNFICSKALSYLKETVIS
ncbi:putative nucleotidyltransferase with HDIG domain [Clostridium pascui]|uniref:HD-GYP domain-containing protein n=1 Tax=Clostridium pascui TaxID=46609 RepID=UPI001958EC4B|nr:HD-GYP domain-containing protein [Clostridium pascui]MBM7870316.1 putative nucleotidyltransferase with HDIG domain [Clostridium pascui]